MIASSSDDTGAGGRGWGGGGTEGIYWYHESAPDISGSFYIS